MAICLSGLSFINYCKIQIIFICNKGFRASYLAHMRALKNKLYAHETTMPPKII